MYDLASLQRAGVLPLAMAVIGLAAATSTVRADMTSQATGSDRIGGGAGCCITTVETAMLRSLLGRRFAVATARPTLSEDALFLEERCHAIDMVAKRRAEFTTVRICARRALAELGVPPCVLVPQPDGSPRWPVGIIGSMSHTDDLCAAAVTRAPDVLAVGIDVERATALDGELEGMIHTASEQAWIRQQDPLARGRLGKMFFSAKEAFYKCQYGLAQTTLDFTDVELGIDMTRQTFHVVRVDAPVASGIRWQDVRGRFGTIGGHLMTVAVMERQSTRPGLIP